MKKKNYVLLLLICLLSSVSLSAQTTTESRSASPFREIHLSGGIDVVYTVGNYALKVEAESNIIPTIETIVENGNLMIRPRKGQKVRTQYKMVVHVSSPQIDKILLNGGSDFYAEELKNTKDISILASGGSDVNISTLTASNVSLLFSGGSDAEINNLTATNCILYFSGGADADVNLDVTSVDAKASGGSDIKLTGKTKSIVINCSGGSDGNVKNLKYDTITANASGSSDISK